VLDHSTIYDRIWGYDFGPESKNLAVYIGYLRRKMDDGHDVKLLHTIRGVGYSVRV
jgi:two-component system, OmpR family, response regulator MprA